MLKLEIVTPERRVLDTEVDFVSLPTASGEAGILPNHAPLISALKPGILTYTRKAETDKLAVSAGFAEVSSDTVSVLVDSAEAADDIDLDAARSARESAEKAIAAAGLVDAEAAAGSREALDHAMARIELGAGR
jgi:F-type H+-transporting ATPase subunit epsilon